MIENKVLEKKSNGIFLSHLLFVLFVIGLLNQLNLIDEFNFFQVTFNIKLNVSLNSTLIVFEILVDFNDMSLS